MPAKKNKSKKPSRRVRDVAEPGLPTLPQLLAATRLASDIEVELAEMLYIPDYNTFSGLKQWHDAFETISSKLDQVFALSRRSLPVDPIADRLAATVIVIYGHGCVDRLLRGRIFKETAFLKSAVSLLQSDMVGSMVTAVLCNVTHLEGTDLTAISPFTPTILDCVERRLHNIELVEGALCVVTHSTDTVLNAAFPDPELTKVVTESLPRIIQLYLRVIHLTTATPLSFRHFTEFCYHTTSHHPDVFRSIPGSIDFLVACTRAQDIRVRNISLRSIQQICTEEMRLPSFTEPLIPNQAMRQDRIAKGWDELIERTTLIGTFADNPDRSLSDFGQSLVGLILRNERDIRSYLMEDVELYVETSDVKADLGCSQFVDVLRLCADAVRCGGSAQAEINGDILQLEYLLASGKSDEACISARLYIERHPAVAFFYYVLATVSGSKGEDVTCVHFAGRGLQCSDLTVFMREELEVFSMISSTRILDDMLGGLPSQVRLRDAFALAQKARSQATSFINDAAPNIDVRYMPLMIAYNVYLGFLLAGHTLSDDASELQAPQTKLSLAYNTARSATITGFVPPQACLGINEIFTRMPSAWRMWKPIVSQQPSKNYSNIGPPVDIAAWLEKIETFDPMSKFSEIRGVNRDAGRSGVAQIHHCASCFMPSVTLKKCSRCQKARGNIGSFTVKRAMEAPETDYGLQYLRVSAICDANLTKNMPLV